jgi:7-keto-8-aminopelargonate synthetase-like enzyme
VNTSAQLPKTSRRNTAFVIEEARQAFDLAYRIKVMGLYGRSLDGRRVQLPPEAGEPEAIVDFVRCSYLGLDNHPQIVRSAVEALNAYGAVHWSCARTRLGFALLRDLEAELSQLFGARAVVFTSVMLANLGAMPLLASGALTGGVKPVMAFDRLCHASLAYHKPVAAAETEVVTLDHNDLSALEALCKARDCVAYIADGVYSMGGAAPLHALRRLQDRYNLFLYIDDAHGISIFGTRGEGFARSQLAGELGARTVIAASLGKGFGASGAVLMLGSQAQEDLFRRYAQPYAFSAAPNLAAVGAARAAAALHDTPELAQRQAALQGRLEAFDARVHTPQKGSRFPIRLVPLGTAEDAILAARLLLDGGVYVSAVFFPTVARGAAALRLCLTATHALDDIDKLCRLIGEARAWRAFDPPARASGETPPPGRRPRPGSGDGGRR